ncbi:PadR family transcriptional regulator [Kitasatospora kifunensis]|nr:PadR family transcriptional regulator [Kitasatospora kifunensis]
MVPGGTYKAMSQLRRGVVEYCVLALLWDDRRYGVEILRELGKVDAMVTSEGTIYPLLSRLHRDALVEAAWQESAGGPPRKYYELTPAGRQALEEFSAAWPEFNDAVLHFLNKNKTR